MKFFKSLPTIAMLAAATALTPLIAQTVEDETQPQASLAIPDGKLFARNDPNVRRASARVNGEVITGTDIDQRMAFLAQGQQDKLAANDLEQFRLQVLGTLVDETMKIQEAAASEIEITQAEVDDYYNRTAKATFQRAPGEVEKLLTSWGSSVASFKRQLKGEIAWNRLLARNVRPNTNVSDAEVAATVAKINAEKGTVEYHVAEIFLRGTADQEEALLARAKGILDSLGKGGSFGTIAKQVSESTTAAIGGDLGWVKASVLPVEMATAVQGMNMNEVVVVPAPGGISLLLLVDTRQIATINPRDAVLSLKQISIDFASPMSEAEFRPLQARFNEATAKISGCGPADEAAAALGAKVVNRDDMRIRDLPPALQDVMLKLQIGQSTPPYGGREDGLRSFVICGRDLPQSAPELSTDAIMEKLEEERVNKRARTYLRDLRRDAIIEYN